MHYRIFFNNKMIGSACCASGMTDEEICEYAGIQLAHTQEEYESAPENGMYDFDDLTIVKMDDKWDCFGCPVKGCIRRDTYRRLPRFKGGLGLCPNGL